jgi:sulfoxide reductase heme-binding subunit YedZ
LNAARLIRLAKPWCFVAAALPGVQLGLATFGLLGQSLGANPVDALTDGLGLWALRLLLATLALTPLRLLTGVPDWVRLRRMLGLWAFAYGLLHVSMYFIVDQRLAIAVLAEDIARRPWITLGFVAFLILLALALTSTGRAMRALGRRWTRLHSLVYLAATLACWHYYWQVKRDVRAPLTYAAVFALLMAVRGFYNWRRRQRATAMYAPPTAPERT